MTQVLRNTDWGEGRSGSASPEVVARKDARQGRVEDVHHLALDTPHVTVHPGTEHKPVYQVGGKSFVFFRSPRPDAFHPDTGQRYLSADEDPVDAHLLAAAGHRDRERLVDGLRVIAQGR
jgi:hypothetical protein